MEARDCLAAAVKSCPSRTEQLGGDGNGDGDGDGDGDEASVCLCGCDAVQGTCN